MPLDTTAEKYWTKLKNIPTKHIYHSNDTDTVSRPGDSDSYRGIRCIGFYPSRVPHPTLRLCPTVWLALAFKSQTSVGQILFWSDFYQRLQKKNKSGKIIIARINANQTLHIWVNTGLTVTTTTACEQNCLLSQSQQFPVCKFRPIMIYQKKNQQQKNQCSNKD